MAELTAEEQLTINEPPELSISKNWARKIFKIFPALRSRNYQLYFTGQVISLIGTWLQIVAQSWLVLELTNSAFYVGLVIAAANPEKNYLLRNKKTSATLKAAEACKKLFKCPLDLPGLPGATLSSGRNG